ncbi:MAG: GxxExxY protein [Candidatus Azotimanducaceae bacterium]|jgi:GxxExxY protein
MTTEIIYKEESYQIMGAAFEVYKEKECLAIEFENQGIPSIEKSPLTLHYKGRKLKQQYEPDFVCFEQIEVEIKAVKSLTDKHRAQVINYLKATGKELGILINFGHYPKVQYERFTNQPR